MDTIASKSLRGYELGPERVSTTLANVEGNLIMRQAATTISMLMTSLFIATVCSSASGQSNERETVAPLPEMRIAE